MLVTEWHEFRRPSFERLKSLMQQPVLFDGRNIWSPPEVRAAGFTYYGIGRGKAGAGLSLRRPCASVRRLRESAGAPTQRCTGASRRIV